MAKDTQKRKKDPKKCRCTYKCIATLKTETKFYKKGATIKYERVMKSDCPCKLVIEEERDDASIVCELSKEEELDD